MNGKRDPHAFGDACRVVQERFSAWLDGETPARAAPELYAHMQACPRCRSDLRGLSRVVVGTRAATSGAVPPAQRGPLPVRSAVERVLQRAAEQCVRNLMHTCRSLLACRILSTVERDQAPPEALQSRLAVRARALIGQLDGMRHAVGDDVRGAVQRLIHAPGSREALCDEYEQARRVLVLEPPPPPLQPGDIDALSSAAAWARQVLTVMERT